MRSILLRLPVLVLLTLAAPATAVDGVIEINDARAMAGGVTPGDLPNYPVTIDRSGSYRLTGDLAVSGSNIDAVQIGASDVELDLNGFSIRCLFIFNNPCAGTGSGVGVNLTARVTNVFIRNGTVRDMASDGIRCGDECALVELSDLRLIANGGNGVDVEGGVVRRSIAHGNGGGGLATSLGVIDSTASDNGSIGISSNGTILGNRSSGNQVGIQTVGGLVSRNWVSANRAQGINATLQANITQNHVLNNAGAAIDGGSTGVGYSNNVLVGNGGAEVQVSGTATNLGGNLCGSDTVCP